MPSALRSSTQSEGALLTSADKPFLTDIETLRKRARQHIDQGPVTQGYGANVDVVVKLLNEGLATEIVCALRYRRHYFMAKGIHAEFVAPQFLERAVTPSMSKAALWST